MATTITPAGYAIEQNGYAIFGVGDTPEAALADANANLAAPVTLDDLAGPTDRVVGRLRLMPVTAALLAQVRDGQDTAGDEFDGVLCTDAEAEAAAAAAETVDE